MRAIEYKTGIGVALIVAMPFAIWLLWPPTPEQKRLRDLTVARGKLKTQIALGVKYVRGDEQAVHDARLASFRAEHRGAEAASAGKQLRARAERQRELNINRLDRLRARLAEVETEIRNMEE